MQSSRAEVRYDETLGKWLVGLSREYVQKEIVEVMRRMADAIESGEIAFDPGDKIEITFSRPDPND